MNAQTAADAREIKILFWSRATGVVALVVSILAIVVTLLMA